jgi:restriction system protein
VVSIDPVAPIVTALETLIDELDMLFDRINEDIKTATYASDYDRIKELADDAKAIKEYRDRLSAARRPLVGLALPEPLTKRVATPKLAKPTLLKKSRGTRGKGITQAAFQLPVLQALDEMGGSAKLSDVLDRIEQMFSEEFTEHDHEDLPNSPGVVRWKNRAQWARMRLKERGLLKPDSPFGVWELSDEGRAFLRASQDLSDASDEDVADDEVIAE